MPAPVLETDRLLLRELVSEDLEALHAVLGDPETMTFYPHPFSRDETSMWIERNRERYGEDGFGLWAVVMKETGELVGDTGLTVQTVDGEDFVEVGWHVHQRMQRRGLATEGGRACLELGFTTLGLDRIISIIRPENVASCKVAENLGMAVWKDTDRAHFLHRVYVLHREDREAAWG